MPVLSTEIFVIPSGDKQYIIYAPLRRAAFIANATVVNQLADIRDGVWKPRGESSLNLVSFLRSMEILDAGTEHLPITSFDGEPEPTSVTLFLTTACNLRCTYCYAGAGDMPSRSMEFAVAKRGIDFVASNVVKKNKSSFDIAYHGGGEPTMNWRVMSSSFEYAKHRASELGLQVRAFLATNGVLSERRIDWIVQNFDGVSMSLDGLPEIQDKNRVTVSGKGSSGQVMYTARRFDSENFNYGLRLTITRDDIAYLPDSIEYLVSRLKPRRIQVEPAYQLGRWSDAPSAETQEFIDSYREARSIASRYNFDIYFSGARLGVLTNHFCGVTQDSFALSPDGNVSGCYEVFSEDSELSDIFFYGKYNADNGEYNFNLATLNKLRRQAVQYREYCSGCYAKWTCAGDCYHKSLAVNGKGEFAGTDRCHITRELTKDQILEKIENSGGVFWHDPPEAKPLLDQQPSEK